MDTKKTQAPKPTTKTPGAAGSVAKDATKHIVKGMKDGESESHSSMADENSLPKTGGESIKNAATKYVKSGLKGGNMKSQNTVSNPSVKKPGLKEDEVLKNAATKHVLNGIKAGEGHTVNMHKTTTISNPGKEKMANSTSGSVTKQETRAPKPKESKPAEEKMAAKTTSPATKQETVAPKPKESKPAEEKKAAPSSKGSTEVGGKKSGLPNMKENESEMALRAGAKGKVYEESWVDESWMTEEPGMDDTNMEGMMGGMDHTHMEGETCDECGMYEDDDKMMESEDEEGDDEETKALNEQIARMKQILRY
jgi:hypothetical protein